MIGETLTLERRVVNAGQNPPARRVVFDLVEQHRRRRIDVRGNFRHRADFVIPIGAFDNSKLAERVHAIQPTAQITVMHACLLRSEPILERT